MLVRIGFFLLAVLLACVRCATVGSPSGGPADETGPDTVGVYPSNESRWFAQNEIRFVFNEFLAPGTPLSEVFISPPLPPGGYSLVTRKRTLFLEFNAPLRDTTTYVLTLGTGVKDFAGKNGLANPIQYAFSTGPQLDSCRVSGKLTDAFSAQAVTDAVVVLFNADSIQNNRFTDREPRYVSLTDPNGGYSLGYLRAGRYRILGLKDANRDYRYTPPLEGIGLPDSFGILLDSTTCRVQRNLRLFVPDTFPPGINGLRWRNATTLEVEFSEAIASIQATTDGNDARGAVQVPLAPTKVAVQVPLQDTAALQLVARDTVGNALDTLLALPKRTPPGGPFSLESLALPLPQPGSYRFWADEVLDTAALALIAVIDTSGKPINASFLLDGFFLAVRLPRTVHHGNHYRLRVDSALVTTAGRKPDSTLYFPLKLENPDNWGTISGSFPATDSTGVPLVLWLNGPKTTYIVRTPEFELRGLPPGKYTAQLLLDADGNGRWSPGQLWPYRPPERVVQAPQAVELRAGWTVEDFQVTLPAEKTSPPRQSSAEELGPERIKRD